MPTTVDLLVVGGGIHGACVARDAARRGLAVLLCEQGDLAQGTSSRSSKLIHGGLRYLATGQFGLVREALAERAILLRTAPGLVRPLPFVLPFYRGAGRAPALVHAGLALYDLLAGPHRGLPAHRSLARGEALALEPDLPAAGLRGAALYHDAQMDDALLVVANAIDAASAGARVETRARIVALAPHDGVVGPTAGAGRGWRATIAHEGGTEVIEARVVVNAGGPWADAVRRLARPGATPALRPTRGSHIVVPALTRGHALLLFASDGRVMFVLPHGSRSLVGTTDVDDVADPASVRPTAPDLRLLVGEIERRWPARGAPIGRAFAGLRPLLASAAGARGPALPWRNTREARILDEDGILSLVGGKYTTARALAARAVDRALRALGSVARPCDTATSPLPAPPGPGVDPGEPAVTEEEIAWAVGRAFARGAGDVIWRRSSLWLDRAAARAAAPAVAAHMAPLLGWTEARRDAEARAVIETCDEEERWLTAAT